jgi:hypothetical protein
MMATWWPKHVVCYQSNIIDAKKSSIVVFKDGIPIHQLYKGFPISAKFEPNYSVTNLLWSTKNWTPKSSWICLLPMLVCSECLAFYATRSPEWPFKLTGERGMSQRKGKWLPLYCRSVRGTVMYVHTSAVSELLPWLLQCYCGCYSTNNVHRLCRGARGGRCWLQWEVPKLANLNTWLFGYVK